MSKKPEVHVLCHRCGRELTPGKGNFYVVRIEAVADPTPPQLDAEELKKLTAEKIDEEINRIIEEMKDMTETELMDHVYRRLVIHLCGRCYGKWIEDPAG